MQNVHLESSQSKKHVVAHIRRYHRDKFSPYVKKNMRTCLLLFSVSFLGGVVLFWVLLMILTGEMHVPFFPKSSSTALLAYESNHDHVFDPYMLTQKIKHGDRDIVLVDIRSANEFATSHIKSAVSIPTYSKVESMNNAVDLQTLYHDFQAKQRKNAVFIVYGPTSFSQITQNVVDMLNMHHLKAMRLGVGWSEFRYFKNFWVPEATWDTFDENEFITQKDN